MLLVQGRARAQSVSRVRLKRSAYVVSTGVRAVEAPAAAVGTRPSFHIDVQQVAGPRVLGALVGDAAAQQLPGAPVRVDLQRDLRRAALRGAQGAPRPVNDVRGQDAES